MASSSPPDGGGGGGDAPPTLTGDGGAYGPPAAHLQDAPLAALADFAITSASGSGDVGDVEDGGVLALALRDDDGGEDGSGGGLQDSARLDEEDDDADDDSAGFQLAARTSQIMSSYRDYISEIQSDPIAGGDAEMAKADLEKASGSVGPGGLSSIDERGPTETGAPLISPYRPFQYGVDYDDGSNDTPKTANLHDVSVGGHRFNDVASFEDFYGELSFHPVRNYKHPFLRSRKFRRILFAAFVFIVVVVVVAAMGTPQKGPGDSEAAAEGEEAATVANTEGGTGGATTPTSGLGDVPGDVPRPFDALEPTYPVQGPAISQRYKETFLKYQPEWFFRDQGWTGTKYADAVFFCATQGSSILCPYEALCPLGARAVPAGGIIKGVEQVHWAPVIDNPNEWVNIGIENTCVRYEDFPGDGTGGPEWGITGEGSEPFTQHVMCCLPKPPEAAIGSGEVDNSIQDDMNIYQAAVDKYQPKQYTRDEGWQGHTYLEAVDFCDQMEGRHVCPYQAICPLRAGSQPLGDYGVRPGEDGPAWVPILDRGNDWALVVAEGGMGGECTTWLATHPEPPEWGVTGSGSESLTRNVLCCHVSEGEVESLHLHDVSRDVYNAEWFGRSDGWKGKTYLQALEYCASRNEMVVCPYDTMCPNGVDGKPYGGMTMAIEAWAPVQDELNSWTMVGQDNSCVAYDSMHPEKPEWGLSGDSEGDITPYVLCCEMTAQAESTVAATEAPMAEDSIDTAGAFDYVSNLFGPVWYERSSGWKGRSYEAAVRFCEASENDGKEMTLCPYEAICPMGPRSEPFGGFWGDAEGEAWAAVGNDENWWVSVSPQNPCVFYSMLHIGNHPAWGTTGDKNEEITRQVMCCEKDAVLAHVVKEQGEAAVLETVEPTEVTAYVTAMYNPTWYDRSSGWTGQSYDSAVAFCDSTKKDGKDQMLCPYQAYCPLGPQSAPHRGFSSERNSEAWAPVSNDHNWWLSLSTDTPCTFYQILTGGIHPDWGITGKDDEEITRNVMCCNKVDAMAVTGGIGGSQSVGEKSEDMPALEEIAAVEDYVTGMYDPIWFDRSSGWKGQTYDAALSFCASNKRDGNALMLCPIEAYCAQGPGSDLFPGSSSAPPGSYAAVSNVANLWVSVSPNNQCTTYRSKGQEIGVPGRDHEELTRLVMCCSAHDPSVLGESFGIESDTEPKPVSEGGDVTVAPTTEDAAEINPADYSSPYAYVADLYAPQWFDRSSGWSGQSYDSAVTFCASKEHNGEALMLCPYQATCPMGPRNTPFGGSWTEPNRSWAAVSNNHNSWVSVDPEVPCEFWNEVHDGNHPKWGLEGGNEELTRHVLCCLEREVASLSGGLGGELSSPESTQSETASPPKPKVDLTQSEKDVLSRFKPYWFGVNDGWKGTTYEEAVNFCDSQDSFHLCPIEVYCHNDPGSKGAKVFGHPEPFEDFQWSPVANKVNEWILVGKVSDERPQTCITYEELYQREPVWGIDGSETPLKKHILCCQGGMVEEQLEGPPPPKDDGAAYVPSEQEVASLLYYEPQWFERKDGWAGTTHEEAETFCATKENMALCPYGAYCPNGPGSPPVGGVFRGGGGDESWAPVSTNSEWVKVDSANVCIHWSGMHPEPPKALAETATQHIMCCVSSEAETIDATTTQAPPTTTVMDVVHDEMVPRPKPAAPAAVIDTPATEAPPADAEPALVSQTFQVIQEKYLATWHDRSSGWRDQSYASAIKFCSSRGSFVPCPYEVYCPFGGGNHVMGGTRATRTFAPMIDTPNGWLSVGPEDTCIPYSAMHPAPPDWGLTGTGGEDVARAVMCCREPEDNGFGLILEDEEVVAPNLDTDADRSNAEQSAMDKYHPSWYDRRHGYHGTSHEEAERFCKNVGGKRLCPIEAYCPNWTPSDAPTSKTDLFLDRPPFEDEQWAPASKNQWVQVGTVKGDATSTCRTYEELKDVAAWRNTPATSRHKKHVLCCADEEEVDEAGTLEDIMKEAANPQWFSKSDGWGGGSYDDATRFCKSQGGRELCPYTAFCPFGEGKPVMGGHAADFDREGVQWSPYSQQGEPNADSWVMIGRKYQNSMTTCMTFHSLEGSSPGDWGGGDGMAEEKRHIMCCLPKKS